ncbi:hypothetical protein [Paracraurococcus ruber]|uniref:hypothetical protein n=1 Tax=Paracraurococcus ruber TaxID=77675 RepID=UPI0013054257|nr:hypothetical protein [Paracraurococcus ruber]
MLRAVGKALAPLMRQHPPMEVVRALAWTLGGCMTVPVRGGVIGADAVTECVAEMIEGGMCAEVVTHLAGQAPAGHA